MNDNDKSINVAKDTCKDIVPVTTNTSGIISIKKCVIKAIHIYANGGDVTATIYNGQNAAGDKVFTLPAKNGYDNSFTFPDTTTLEKGLFIDLSSDKCECCVMYIII